MLSLKSIAITSMITASALAMPAFAAHFNPVGTTITATGNTALTAGGANIPCTSTFVLVTDAAGNAQVTQATFSGSSALCGTVKAAGLPWPLTAGSNLSDVTIQNIKVTGPLGISCGPANITGQLSNAQLALNSSINPGNCSVSGTLATSPSASIAP